MNFLPGVLRTRTASAARRVRRWLLAAGAAQAGAAQDGQQVLYGARPEHMQLGRRRRRRASEVVVVEPTGADTQVFTKLAGVEITSVFRERHDFRPGEIIRLRPDPVRAHLFDAASGVRLAR
jgi:multiple sugar transport system ATP-binding protein